MYKRIRVEKVGWICHKKIEQNVEIIFELYHSEPNNIIKLLLLTKCNLNKYSDFLMSHFYKISYITIHDILFKNIILKNKWSISALNNMPFKYICFKNNKVIYTWQYHKNMKIKYTHKSITTHENAINIWTYHKTCLYFQRSITTVKFCKWLSRISR